MTLRDCPFCGGKASFVRIPHAGPARLAGGEFVECADCQASSAVMFPIKGDVRRDLAGRWNLRYDKLLDALKEARSQLRYMQSHTLTGTTGESVLSHIDGILRELGELRATGSES